MNPAIEWTFKDGILRVAGRLDATTAAAFEEAANTAMGQSPSLCIECAGVPYISSAGLRVLMLAIRELSKRNETLRLTAVSPEVYHVLYLSGFTSLAQVEKTHE